jgi:hypothetical protein
VIEISSLGTQLCKFYSILTSPPPQLYTPEDGDTVQKHIYSNYHSPSSEPYRVNYWHGCNAPCYYILCSQSHCENVSEREWMQAIFLSLLASVGEIIGFWYWNFLQHSKLMNYFNSEIVKNNWIVIVLGISSRPAVVPCWIHNFSSKTSTYMRDSLL